MKKLFTLFAFTFFSASIFSQSGYWKPVTETEAQNFSSNKNLFRESFKPAVYKIFNLDESSFRNFISKAPDQKTKVDFSTFVIEVPDANGSIQHFQITESPVMQPKLQAKHPEIKTYVGKGIENKSATIRFDVTPLGFHAIIISADKSTVYINPVTNANQLYIVFDRDNLAEEKQVFDCKVDKILNSNIQGVAQLATTDANLRTYRFAVASGGEFSQLFLNGTETSDAQRKSKILSGLVTDLVRTNAIFETDFGVHLSYVDNEDTIIFLNGSTDPFLSSASGYSSGQWNSQSQSAIDKYIGSANYDVGHLLMGYGTGGNAGCIGCVCKNATKGSGVTGFTTNLTSDPFIVDFWDHEIGHQFGGNHTFDYSYEGTIAQMEPGSGSTIMGYAGTTGGTDIQPHSDPYFHAVSIQQIDTYITTGAGAGCAVVTATGNQPSIASANADYVIPKSTPFALSGGRTNADHDLITYCWEQYDVYKNNNTSKITPDSTATTGPVFRSYTPTEDNIRSFPKLSSILDGTNKNKWEVLPGVARKLNFRLTVRDNHPGGGSTSSDDMVVTVDGNSGPFILTAPNTNISWAAGSVQTIKWNVANTNVAPVNCTMVNILLSNDGGKTFKVTLKTNTPNDGSETVTLPSATSTKARIKIVAVNNIFFDISNTNFKITATAFVATANHLATASSLAANIAVQPNPAQNFTNVIFNKNYSNGNLVLTNEEGKIMFSKTISSGSKGNIEKISLQQFTPGVYFLKITTDGATQTQKIIKN